MGKKNNSLGVIIIVIVVAALVSGAGFFITGLIEDDSDSDKSVISSASDANKEDAAHKSDAPVVMSNAPSNAATDDAAQKGDDTQGENGLTMDSSADEVYEYFKNSTNKDIVSFSNSYMPVQITSDDSGKVTLIKNGTQTYEFNPPAEIDDASTEEMDFYDKDNGICMISLDGAAGSTYYDVYITHDGGKSWTKTATQGISGFSNRLFMVGKNDAYLISSGSAYGSDIVYVTHNEGKTWKLVENELMDTENGVFYVVHVSGDKNVVFVAKTVDDVVSDGTLFETDSDWEVINKASIGK